MFEKLKEFIKVNFDIDININIPLNINYKSNNISKPVEYNGGSNSLVLNSKKISTLADLGELQGIIKESYNEGAVLLQKESNELVEDVKLKEGLADVKLLLEFFKNKIPIDDYNVLRSAIYIKERAEDGAGFDEIYRLKGNVGSKYGVRGLNICNLYASGYFKDMIMPLYGQLSQPDLDDKFINKYNIIINETAFALFVSGNMDNNEVKTAITRKIDRNLRYGIRTVSIHGIGRNNKEKIIEAISDIEKEYPPIEKNIEETDNIILAKLSF